MCAQRQRLSELLGLGFGNRGFKSCESDMVGDFCWFKVDVEGGAKAQAVAEAVVEAVA